MTEIALLVHFKLLNLVDQYEICYLNLMSFSLNKYLQEDPTLTRKYHCVTYTKGVLKFLIDLNFFPACDVI